MLSRDIPRPRPDRGTPFAVVFSPTIRARLVIDANGYSEHQTEAEALRHRDRLDLMLSRSALRVEKAA